MCKEKKMIIFDIFVFIVILISLFLGTSIEVNGVNIKQLSLFANTQVEEYNFDLKVDPEETRVKAGETVQITLGVENIDMGESGINNVVGYLSFDESIFESVNIEGANDNWKFEQNTDKNHEMYGKFVIYSMTEGVTENQDVVKMTLELKKDLQPQRTEINFTRLKSSDGEISVDDDDRKAVIEIYEDEPVQPEEPTEPEEPIQPETPQRPTISVKTGDKVILSAVLLVVFTAILNVLILTRHKSIYAHNKYVKTGVVTTVLLVIVGVAVLIISAFAHNAETTELIGKLDLQESWLNSEKYLVTDENVSRIAPITSVENMNAEFNKLIKVYKNAVEGDGNNEEEITSGLITTGMTIKDDKDSYAVSVLGDINADGYSDHVELTTIVRNIVDNEKWNLENEKELSADMNVDGKIDPEDVDVSIKYILYGELDIPGFDQVEAPKLEVVEGTFYDYIDAYEDTIKVKITEQDENAIKTKYKIEGTTEKEYQEIEDGGVIELTENGVYKVSAYSYGELGNRSSITYSILVKKNPNATYKVEKYIENADGTYEKVEEERTGRIGTTVTIDDEIPDGYQVDEEKSKITGIVPEDEPLTLTVYYDRKEYTLTIKAGDNIDSVSMQDETQKEISKKIKFGKQVDISANIMEEEGYTVTWSKWVSSDVSVLGTQDNQNATFEMPMSDIEMTATATKKVNKYEYSVEYYYDDVISSSDTEMESADYGTEINDYTPKESLGYTFEKTENLPLTVGINKEQNIIKVYYKSIDYKISYDLMGGELAEGDENPTVYKVTTDDITLKNPTKQGYYFAGWHGGIINESEAFDTSLPTGKTGNIGENSPLQNVTIQKGSVGNRKYIANWAPDTDTLYTVEHYLQNLDGSYEKNDEYTQKRYGTTGSQVTAEAISINGYKENTEIQDRIPTGEIKEDGSLVLRLYYDRNEYSLKLTIGDNISSVGYRDVTNNGEKVTSEENIEVKFKFGTEVEIYSELEEELGHEVKFSKWNSSDTSLVQNQLEKDSQITMPIGDVELEAIALKENSEYKYTIKYYYDGDEDENEREEGTAEYGSQVTLDDKKEVDGYEIDHIVNEQLTISEDESQNVIEVYHRLINYKISYELGGGTLGENSDGQPITNPESYTIKDENFKLNNPKKDGFEFLGWTGSNGEEPNTDVEVNTQDKENKQFTANWKSLSYVVTVHHYLADTNQRLAEDEVYTSEELGKAYTTDHLIPQLDEDGNSIETDGREYLDPIDFYVVNDHPEGSTGVFTVQDIEVIYYYDYYPVVKIIKSPEQSLVGQTYKRISEALEALKAAGLDKDSEQSVLQLIRESRDESATVKNHNVALDLNGFTANSKSEDESTFIVEDASFTIIDDSAMQNGKVNSENTSAIYVKTTGEFTLGKEPEPVNQTPVIEGKTVGVEKEIVGEAQGKFNFYDGKIIGDNAISGKVDLTPVLYDATVTDEEEEEDKRQVSILAIVADVEARIGRKTYTQLEGAIDDANKAIGASGEQVVIVVVKDLAKLNSVEIDNTKNIKLDLEGHTITTSTSDYVFKNYGKLEIVDTKATGEETYDVGKITNTTAGTIYNGMSESNVIRRYEQQDYKSEEEYSFTSQENGKMVSNNASNANSTANSYIEIDLTGMEGSYLLKVNAEISCKKDSDYGYATITNTKDVPTYDSAIRRFIYITGSVEQKDYTTTLNGGNKYYLHLGYRKSGTQSTGGDAFTINEITLNELSGSLKLTSGIIETVKAGSDIGAIVNEGGIVEINGGEVLVSQASRGIRNIKGAVNVNGGFITNGESTTSGYGIENLEDSIVNLNDGTNMSLRARCLHNKGELNINNGTFTTSRDSLIYNDGVGYINILNADMTQTYSDSTGVIDDRSIGDINIKNAKMTSNTNGIGSNNAGCIHIENINIQSRNKGISCSGKTNLIFEDGELNNGISFSSTGKAEIKRGNIKGNAAITASKGTVNIYDATISGVSGVGVSTSDTATVNISGGSVTSDKKSAITAAGNSKINIKKTDTTSSDEDEVSDNIDISASQATVINVTSTNATVDICDAVVTAEADNNVIENIGTINLGEDDNSISTENPRLVGKVGIINSTGTFNFFDGKITADIYDTIRGKVSDVPENSDVIIKTNEDGKQDAIVGVPDDPVAKIGDDEYSTLESAIEAVEENQGQTQDGGEATRIELLKDIFPAKKITIPQNKNIIIDTNQYIITGLSNEALFENNGKLELVSEIENQLPTIDISNGNNKGENDFTVEDNKLVSNNTKSNTTVNTYFEIDLTRFKGRYELKINAELLAGGYGYATITENENVPEYNSTEGRFMYITTETEEDDYTTELIGGKKYYLHLGYRFGSNGKLTVNGISLCVKGLINTYTSNNMIENKGSLKIENVDVYLYAKGASNSSQISVINNTGDVKIENNANLYTSTYQYVRGINNDQSGNVTVNNGKVLVSTSNADTYGIYNLGSGSVNITEGKITGGYAGIYNNAKGAITVNSGRVEAYKSIIRYAIYNNSEGEITTNGGIFIGGLGIYLKNGKATINNGIFKGGIETYNSSNLLMKNGTIEGRVYMKNSSSVEVNGGTIKNNENAEAIIGSTKDNTIIITGGTFSNKPSANYACIKNVGTLTVSGGEITGQVTGIENTGTATITGGTITGINQRGIKSTGTLTLGTKDGVAHKDYPSITGAQYGVDTGTSTFNFYDGIIKGAAKQAISGTVKEQEEGYEIIKEETDDGTKEEAYLDKRDVAQIESTKHTYGTLKEAFEACEKEGETVNILRNAIINENVDPAEVSSGKKITLDLKGFELSAGNENTITVKGNLTIKDSSEQHTGNIKNTAKDLIRVDNGGELTVNSGNLEVTVEKNVITCGENGKVTLSGCNINAGSTGTGVCVQNGNLIINDGTTITVKSDKNAVYVDSTDANVEINGGTIGINGYGLYNNVACQNIKIKGGTLGQIYNKENGKIVIGTEHKENVETEVVPDTKRIYNNGLGEIDIKNVRESNSGNCVYNESGTINIYYCDLNTTGSYTTVTNNSGTINIHGGEIKGNYKGVQNGSSNKQATLNMSGGEITIKGRAFENYSNATITAGTITSTSGYGLVNYKTLTVGNEEGEIDNNNIEINGKTYGMLNLGTLNYHEGTIKGEINKAIYGKIDKMPEGEEILYEIDNDNNRETATLGNTSEVAQIGDDKYDTLKEAFSACQSKSGQTTIELLKYIGVGGDSQYVIDKGEDIKLDLNGNRIQLYNAINNNGTFEITDSSGSKDEDNQPIATVDVSYTMVNNTGTFNFSGGKVYSYMHQADDDDYTYANSGTRSIINNSENGKIKMSDGYICNRIFGTGTVYVIDSKSADDIQLSGGEIYVRGTYYSYEGSVMNVIKCESIEGEERNITINGTKLRSSSGRSSYAISLDSKPNTNITIQSGTIESGFDRAIAGTSKSITISGGEIKSSIDVKSDKQCNVTINGGTIASASFSNYNDIKVTKGTCTKDVSLSNFNTFSISDGTMQGKLTINSGTSEISGGTLKDVVLNGGAGTTSITGGEITGELTIGGQTVTMTAGSINNSEGNGVKINSGEFTLGVLEDPPIVNTTAPTITGSTYGVYKSKGTFNFYDGVITGNGNQAIYGEVDKLPKLYSVVTSDEGRVAKVGIIPTFEQVAEMNDVYYKTVQSAVDAANQQENIIKIADNVTIAEPIQIKQGQNITIDLAGYSIQTTGVEATIINNGTLTIIDSTATTESPSEIPGTVQNYSGVAIKNNETLTIGTEDENEVMTAPYIVGGTYGIENNGQLNVYDGRIEGKQGPLSGSNKDIQIPNGHTAKIVNNVLTLIKSFDS